MTWDRLRVAPNERTSDPDEFFLALVHRHSSFVFRLAFAVLRNQHDAEDVVQETFLKIYRKGSSSCKLIDDERAYLARVAWRLAVHSRAQRKRPMPLPELESSHPSPEQSVSDTDWNRHIQILIDGLPEELRDPLLLFATEELTSLTISQMLGIPEGTVRNRLFRARQLLRQKIAFLLGRPYAR